VQFATAEEVGRLDGLTTLLPDTIFFLYLYIQKEALLSSQIEGTQSSFSDLLLFENDAEPSVPMDDVEEVSNYVAAMLVIKAVRIATLCGIKKSRV
jgi:Fic family protein